MLGIDLSKKLALVAGVADDQGFGWAIAKAFQEAGAKVILACWPPALGIFEKMLERGKLDRSLWGGGTFEWSKMYALDVMYDSMEDVPEEIKNNRRYQNRGDFSIAGLREQVEKDFGEKALSIVVHSIANSPEVTHSLGKTSRKGYLSASSASAYSFVRMVQEFSPIMESSGSFLALSYVAGNRVVPNYGGGMSGAKAALESDARVLAYEMGQKYGHRVNVISAGPWASRAASAITSMKKITDFVEKESPGKRSITPRDVATTAAFLASPLASGITASTVYVDSGMHSMNFQPELQGNN